MTRLYRKNFLPTVVANLILWIICGSIVYFTSPETTLNVIIFFVFFFLALFITLALLFGNTRRGFFLAIFTSGLLILRLINQMNLLNIFLLLAIVSSAEIYFSHRSKHYKAQI